MIFTITADILFFYVFIALSIAVTIYIVKSFTDTRNKKP